MLLIKPKFDKTIRNSNNDKDLDPKFEDDTLLVNSAEVHASYLLQTAQKYAE